MTEGVIVAIIGAAGLLFGALVGHRVADRRSRRDAQVAAATVESTSQNQLIDQLQEELARYRERTDARLDTLEAENRGYRAFIGIQRDHMAEHNIPLPPWPEGLPR